MAKKNLPATAVDQLLEKANDASESAREIIDALRNMRIDDLRNPSSQAYDLMCACRDLQQCAIQLLSRHEFQQMQAQTKAMVEELAQKKTQSCK